MFSKSKINEPGPKATDTETGKKADAGKTAGSGADFKASAPKAKPTPSLLSSDLLIMELSGLIEKLPGSKYQKI